MPEELVEVTLHGMAYGGAAVGRLPDGRAVFIPFALPGERVLARLTEVKKGHALAEVVEILTSSPERVAAPCRHFTACGGCHYQHIPYPQQLATKQAVVRDQLERLGGISNPKVLLTAASPHEYGYRNHIQLHISPAGKPGYQPASGRGVLEIQECLLPDAALDELWPRLEFDPQAGIDRAALRLGTNGDALVVLESRTATPPEFSTDLPVSAVWQGPRGPLLLAGDDHVVMEVKGRSFKVSAGSFFQVNTQQAGAMVDFILQRLPARKPACAFDLYCGAGLFSAFLAGIFAEVAGIESSGPACQDFIANLDEFDNVRLYEGKVEDVLPFLEPVEAFFVADPPRAGFSPAALDAVLRWQPAFLAYISCDPATLGRDIRRLAASGYRLIEAAPFDMFPQTYHIETIAVLEKIRSNR